MNNSTPQIDPELQEAAVFGEIVHNFMVSEIGVYITQRAQNMEHEALLKLRRCDPENAGSIRQYQNEADVPALIIGWLKDAISDGAKALQILETREQGHED